MGKRRNNTDLERLRAIAERVEERGDTSARRGFARVQIDIDDAVALASVTKAFVETIEASRARREERA